MNIVDIRSRLGCSGGPLCDEKFSLLGILLASKDEGTNEFMWKI